MWNKRYDVLILMVLLLLPTAFCTDQNTTATLVITESYDWSQFYEDTNSTLISVDGAQIPFQQTASTMQIQSTSTFPTVSYFSYSYDTDTNTLILSFTLTDSDASKIYVTSYAIVDGNVLVLDQSIQVSSGVQITRTYTVYPEPSAVYISFISEAPGAYPENIPFTAPKFVMATSIIPIDFDYSGNVIIVVSNGYSIYPLQVTEGYRAYVIASSAGVVGISVTPAQ